MRLAKYITVNPCSRELHGYEKKPDHPICENIKQSLFKIKKTKYRIMYGLWSHLCKKKKNG